MRNISPPPPPKKKLCLGYFYLDLRCLNGGGGAGANLVFYLDATTEKKKRNISKKNDKGERNGFRELTSFVHHIRFPCFFFSFFFNF